MKIYLLKTAKGEEDWWLPCLGLYLSKESAIHALATDIWNSEWFHWNNSTYNNSIELEKEIFDSPWDEKTKSMEWKMWYRIEEIEVKG